MNVMLLILLMLIIIHIILCVIVVLEHSGIQIFHILGFPLYWNDVKWTWFVYKHINNADFLDVQKEYLYYDGYVISFHYSWMWFVYEGKSIDEIMFKYSLGGQSNKASYLVWWQKIIGKKIEKKYLKLKERLNEDR